jgi:ATP-dependent Clp protease protease subunit
MAKFWNFTRNKATDTEPASVELRIEGDIVSSDDAWIYEWFGIPVASPNAFRNELSKYKGQDITVWIDSYGGDVFAAAGIYNALKEHDGKVTTKIDGKAMSAASVIAMAGDEILMSPVSIMMIHNPLSAIQGYASDMRKAADVLDTVKETIVNAYKSKTGLSEDKIASMMDDESYMSANTAVKEGFADGVLYQENTETQKVMNFAFNRLSIQNCINDSVNRLFELDSQTSNSDNIKNNKGEGSGEMEIKNVEEFKTQLPEIHKEVHNAANLEGIKAERERLKTFDMLNGKVDAALLNEEKYKDGATAESVLFKAMQEGKMINNSYVAQAQIDAGSANQVPGTTSDNNQVDEVTGILNFVQNAAKKTLGGK